MIGWLALLALLALASDAPASSFDVYSVHLEPAPMPETCERATLSPIRNFTHRYRGAGYPHAELSIREGKSTESAGGKVQWETSIERQEPIDLDGTPAILMVVFSNHVAGTGSTTHVLVIRCREQRLEAIFEAGGEGVAGSYSPADGLQIDHAVWLPKDEHAEPSRMAHELYRWQPKSDRFELAGRSEKAIDGE